MTAVLHVLITPRSSLDQLSTRSLFNTFGVYLLLGSDAAESVPLSLYIGASDRVADAVMHRGSKHRQWHTAALFVSKDDALDGPRARWIAAQLTALATQRQRTVVVSEVYTDIDALLEVDLEPLRRAIAQVRNVLTTMGFDVLASQDANPPAIAELASFAVEPEPRREVFGYAGDGFSATMEATSKGYVVREGSLARIDEAASLQPTYRSLRSQLRAQGVLLETLAGLRFTGDYAFNSPSAAACVVSGTTVGGGGSWKLPSGMTYAEWDAARSMSR